jgi:4-diphosphocytidyl-2-C-methyl-D-erythritol kinase
VLVAQANGKINLGLEIIDRRPDGFHNVATILQQVNLGDRLTFQDALALTLSADDPMLANEENLIFRAAQLLRSRSGVSAGARITLEKRIPIAAGLGGGSADAGVTLLALNKLWGLGRSTDELVTIARSLGADVAFFLKGGTQLATGRGDDVEPLPTPPLSAVLVLAEEMIADKTRRLYRALQPGDYSDGSRIRRIADELRAGHSVDIDQVFSGFRRVTCGVFPTLGRVFAELAAAGGTPSLCGAGPTVMSLHQDYSDAVRVASTLEGRGFSARVVQSVPSNGWLIDECDAPPEP